SIAGTYNPKVSIGDQAPAWTDLPGVDGKNHSLKDFENRDVVVVVFTCNTCPYAVDYEERINRLAEKYAGADARVGVVAINVNQIEADALPAMKARAEQRKFRFPYLRDESQQIAKDFGAVRTPEFFVLDKSRRIIYMGAMDDSTKESEVKHRYVEDAIEAALNGKQVAVTEIAPTGCLIRTARQRQRK
ncbi:MAG: thioredoxin family protein, partial [Aureliella sp.]